MCAFCSDCRLQLVFLAGVMIALGRGLPRPDPIYWVWVLDGAGMQFARPR